MMVFLAVSILLLGCTSEVKPVVDGGCKRTHSQAGKPTAESDDSGSSSPVRISAGAAAALKKLSEQGQGPWVIFVQGLCNGKPAIGIYEAGANPPKGGEKMTVKGVQFIIEDDVMDLIDKHGDVHLDGPVDKDKFFNAFFIFRD
jgi:hypothetical protein